MIDWRPMSTAPTDGTLFLVWCPGRDGLPPMFSLCAYHPGAGFCVDECREPTHWHPLTAPSLRDRVFGWATDRWLRFRG